MRTECSINADAQAGSLDRLETALERERDGLAVVDAADLAAAIEAIRGLVGSSATDRRRVKFDRTAS